MLIIAAIIGRAKASTYVGFVALFSTVAGYACGAWIDGSSALAVALSLGAFIAALALAVSRAGASHHAMPRGT